MLQPPVHLRPDCPVAGIVVRVAQGEGLAVALLARLAALDVADRTAAATAR
jgi:hypothetical protein